MMDTFYSWIKGNDSHLIFNEMIHLGENLGIIQWENSHTADIQIYQFINNV